MRFGVVVQFRKSGRYLTALALTVYGLIACLASVTQQGENLFPLVGAQLVHALNMLERSSIVNKKINVFYSIVWRLLFGQYPYVSSLTGTQLWPCPLSNRRAVQASRQPDSCRGLFVR